MNKKERYDDYIKERNELIDLEAEKKDLEKMRDKLKDQYSESVKAKLLLKTEKNSRYQALKKKKEQLEKLKESANTFDLTSLELKKDDEWDTEGLFDRPEYSLDDEAYAKFLNLYFYDPDDISKGDKENARLEYQAKRDQIGRNRRYLLVNTAAHLLQVTATVRREIPIRQQAIFKYYKEAINKDDDLNRAKSYGMTRIEEAKTSLLFAKVLSAKLQYLAARELAEIDVEKDWKDGDKIKSNYSKFDLGRYILTKEYVDREYNRKNGDKKNWQEILGGL